jgi:hypothetical protein
MGETYLSESIFRSSLNLETIPSSPEIGITLSCPSAPTHQE